MSTRTSRRAVRAGADLMLAPAVIALRMPLLMAEYQAGHHSGPETTRAVMEKTNAAALGVLAAQASLVRSAFDFWPQILSGRVPGLLSGEAQRKALEAAAGPAAKAVGANHRRLSRRKRQA